MPDRYTNQLIATGFVGDYQGSQDSVDFHLPVVAKMTEPTRYFVPSTESWTSTQELRELDEADNAYVNPFPGNQPEMISPGDVVLVAGANFTDWLRISPGLKSYAQSIDGYWSGLGGLYTYRLGTRREFEEIVQGVWNRGVPRFYNALFSPPDERSAALASTYFRLLSNLTGISMRDQVLLHGTYYHQTRNPDYYELWGQTSVRHEVFGTFDDYQKAILDRIEFLAAERVAERSSATETRAPSPVPSTTRAAARQSDSGRDLLKLALNSQVHQVGAASSEVPLMDLIRAFAARVGTNAESSPPSRASQLAEYFGLEDDVK